MAAIQSSWSYYPITGVPVQPTTESQLGPNKKVPIRQNIETWSSNPANEKQVKLFVLALYQFQQIDPHDRDSYFQIAGIHGQPNVPWDEPIDKNETAGRGYCTHNNILFPLWHRAYLALYEQRIQEIMVKEIIPNFPKDQQAAWNEAAQTWRLPFWDWGTHIAMPTLCKYPLAVVPNVNGVGERSIPNPLYQFHMPNNKPMSSEGMDNFKDPWVDDGAMLFYGECIGTSRWPEETDIVSGAEPWRHGVVNNYKVREALKKPSWIGDAPYGQTSEMAYRLLTIPMEYSTFATAAQLSDDQTVGNDNNIEYLHNSVHGWVGGDFNGHMSQIPVATFDPSFWLHHCNIDRLAALWQALNPEKWFEEGTVNEFFQDTVGLPNGTKISPKTELRPFHKTTAGTLMTPEDVRWTYNLGYAYPETQTWKEEYSPKNTFDSTLFLNDLRKTVNELYGVSRTALVDSSLNLKGVEYLDDMVKSMDYSFSVRFCKYGLGGDPFWLRLYLSQDGKTQNPTTDLITEVYNFSQKPVTEEGKVACENCKEQQNMNIKITAFISITPVLVNLIKSGKDLSSLKKDEVLSFLQKRVYWRVFRNGKEVPRYLLDPLAIEIVGSTNDATNFNDATKAPIIENLKEEPTISGGADGALDPSLKQPMTVPPPPKPDIPSASLKMNSTLPFKDSVKADAVVILDSSSVNMAKAAKTTGIDNTQIFLSDSADRSGNILFLLSVRRAEGVIVFNTNLDGKWGQEVRVPLEKKFRTETPSILIHDQGDGYEVFIDWRHVLWFEKRAKDKVAKSVSYSVNEGNQPAWSDNLKVSVFPSMSKVFER